MTKLNITPVTIVVPVYGDWPSLKICIESLLDNINHDKDTVLLVNDCGPEVELIEKNIKALIKGHDNFIYERNPKNLGFVQTCNRAVLKLDKTNNDIMLLNSDASLTQGALQELQDLLAAEKSIGVVSPRSNNATICTIPIQAINQKGINRKNSYKLFKKYHEKYSRYRTVPTAHGFCMLIKRDVIRKIGLFDEIFGRGYGEEVDFCQRTKAAGWTCAISNWSFVYHLEARSFSLDTKKTLLETNGKIVRERYPEYKKSIDEIIRTLKDEELTMFSAADKMMIKASIATTKSRKKIHTILRK